MRNRDTRFLSPHIVQTDSGIHPATFPAGSREDSFPGEKGSCQDAYQSHPSSNEVNTSVAITTLFLCCIAWRLIKPKESILRLECSAARNIEPMDLKLKQLKI